MTPCVYYKTDCLLLSLTWFSLYRITNELKKCMIKIVLVPERIESRLDNI